MQREDKEQKIIDAVKDNKDLEPYFFEKIIEKKDVKWFNILKQNGFFNIENIQYVKENEYIEKWYVLEYLKSIIEDLHKNKCLDILDEIKLLLTNVSEKSNNSKVFQQSVEILNIIPDNLYDIRYIETMLRNWADKENIYIYYTAIDLISNLTENKEIEKSISVLKIVLENALLKKLRIDYLMNRMNTSIEAIAKGNLELLIETLIEILESYLFIESSSRNIEKSCIKLDIKRNEEGYQITRDGKILLEDDFKDRNTDIKKIKDKVKETYNEYKTEDIDRITKLLYGDLFSKESIESLYSTEIYKTNTDEYIINLIKEVLKNNISNEQINKIIIDMINNKYDLIIKLGIYGLNLLLKESDAIFNEIIKENEYAFNYILRFYIFDEDTKFILQKLKNLSEESITLLDKIIDEEEYINHNFGEEFINIWKQKRYKALSSIPYFEKKWEDIKEKTKTNAELGPCITIGEVYEIKQKSPIDYYHIKTISNEELVDEIMKFKPIRNFDLNEEISYEGFGREINKVLHEEPERFYKNLKLFNEIPFEFMCYIIDGFDIVLKEKKINSALNIFKFFSAYIEREDFWNKTDKHRYSSNVVLKRIFNFICDYLNNDTLEFNDDIYDSILDLLNICIEKINYNEYEEKIVDNEDYEFYILNNLISINNQVLLALALKIKRIEFEHWEQMLNNELYNFYKMLLEKCPKNTNLTLGYYIQQFTYINKEWIKSIIINNTNDDQISRDYFIAGYLLNARVDREYFDLMKLDYIKFIKSKFKDKNVIEGLIGHITIAYLNGFDYKNEIIDELIKYSDDFMIIYIIEVCNKVTSKSLLKEVSSEEFKERILYIWESINKIVEDNKYNDLSKIMKEATKFIKKFDEINSKIKTNLEKSFQYLGNDFYTYDLVNYLNNQQESLTSKNSDLENLIKEFFYISTPISPENELKLLLNYISIDNIEVIMEIFKCYRKKFKEYTAVGSYIREIISK